MQHVKHVFMMTWFLLLVGVLSSFGQQKFHVESFSEDPFDLTARNEQYKKIDGSGSLYSIIKVSGEDLKEYSFNFGYMNHIVVSHDDQLWVYVQKNAKQVTITRNGYSPLRNYDLHTTIEAGKTYSMRLSAQGPVVYMQMTLFQVKPAVSGATVLVRKEGDADAPEEVFGTTDASGNIAKSMEYGTYTYRVMAENYYSSEGRFTLNNQNETHHEDIGLRSSGANITFSVDADADIYVNNIMKGTRTWTGSLKAGNYQVECRQLSHRTSFQTITVVKGEDRSLTLTPPTPITGVLAITSSPINANIKIDGKDYGTTPRNITDVLVGKRVVTLSMDGYIDEQDTVEIKEQQTTDLSLTLTEGTNVVATPVGAPLPKGNKTFTVNGISFDMVYVDGGTFQMGSDDGASDEEPVHAVTLNSYYIGATEVTQELWQAVMGKNPSYKKRKDFPVSMISWENCLDFIIKLNILTGQQFRLPSEAEWEFACKGGVKSKGYKFSGSDNAKDVAVCAGEGFLKPVRSKEPNELGLYDMSGNVYEWVQDVYDNHFYKFSPGKNPQGPSSGNRRVLRGGSYCSYLKDCRVSSRYSKLPTSKEFNVGLRLALSE